MGCADDSTARVDEFGEYVLYECDITGFAKYP
jgi:hypothetical protein